MTSTIIITLIKELKRIILLTRAILIIRGIGGKLSCVNNLSKCPHCRRDTRGRGRGGEEEEGEGEQKGEEEEREDEEVGEGKEKEEG